VNYRPIDLKVVLTNVSDIFKRYLRKIKAFEKNTAFSNLNNGLFLRFPTKLFDFDQIVPGKHNTF